MGVTISLAILSSLAQFGIAYLAYLFTETPKHQMTTRRKHVFHGLFLGCGFVTIACVAIMTYLSGRLERAHFALDLNSKVQAVAGTPLSMRIGFKNVGTGPSINTDSYSRSFIQGDESRRSADDAIAQFNEYAKNRTIGTDNVPKDTPGYFMVAQGNLLSDQDVLDLVHNVRVMYIVGTIKFKDDFGHHTQYICKTLQRPVSANGASWGTCGEFDDEE